MKLCMVGKIIWAIDQVTVKIIVDIFLNFSAFILLNKCTWNLWDIHQRDDLKPAQSEPSKKNAYDKNEYIQTDSCYDYWYTAYY